MDLVFRLKLSNLQILFTNSMMGFVSDIFAVCIYCVKALRSLCHTGLWHQAKRKESLCVSSEK